MKKSEWNNVVYRITVMFNKKNGNEIERVREYWRTILRRKEKLFVHVYEKKSMSEIT